MKKLSIFIQWLLVLGFLGFAVHALLKGQPLPDRQPKAWRSWEGFMAISYPGIGTGDSSVYTTPKKLQQQLVALHAAGYRTITLEDALAFLKEDAPLPPKALLLLFEGGRKDSIIFTIKPFRKTGFSGVICLPTRVMRSHGAFFLRRGDFKNIAKMKFWEFAAMGHKAIDEIPVSPDEARGHFLTQRKWTENGIESPEAFQQRVTSDYATCITSIEKETGTHPIAYIYPFADAGRGPEADPEAERINREEVTSLFQMAFVRANNPFNGPGRNPYNLTRLRVPGNLTGEELVQKLERYAPKFYEIGGIHDVDTWQVDGKARFMEDGLEIPAGSVAWLRGSDSWSDVELNTTIQIFPNTTAAIYVRYSSPKSFLRVTLVPEGIRVQENQQGKMQTLSWHPDSLTENDPVALRLRVKGSRVWLWHGEKKLAGPLPLTAEPQKGRVGLGADAGTIQVKSFTAMPLVTAYAIASGIDQFPAKDHPQTKALIVPLKPITNKPGQKHPRAILTAAGQGTEIIPLLPAGEAQSPALKDLKDLLSHPISHNLISRVAIQSPNSPTLDQLHEMNLGIIAILPASDLAQENFDVTQLNSDDMILVDGSEKESLVALNKLLATIPAYRIIGYLDDTQSMAFGISRAIRYGP